MLRRVAAEAVGTGVLVAAVVGSGILATRLTSDVLLALLVNAAATVAVLGVLIAVLAPVSGAHLNPAVTLIQALHRQIPAGQAVWYGAAQVTGGLVGVAVANLMFDLPAYQASTHPRAGIGPWLGEVIATAGLLFTIVATTRTGRPQLLPFLVPAWIAGAYFFTASTSFANPAVTLARSLTDTFTGISPATVRAFIAAQTLGALLGAALAAGLLPAPEPPKPPALNTIRRTQPQEPNR